MLMDLGANVYSEDFEQHFLLKAAEFYQVGASLLVMWTSIALPASFYCNILAASPTHGCNMCRNIPTDWGTFCTVQVEAQEYLGSCTCAEYLRKAEKRLTEETERTVSYLDPSSEAKITRVVENELVKKQVFCLLASPCYL